MASGFVEVMMRKIEKLRHWEFRKDEAAPEMVTVPHDWAITGPFDRNNDRQLIRIEQDGETEETEHNGRTAGLPYAGKGEYHRLIKGPEAPGHRVFLDFDGVMSHAQIQINGQFAGGCNYGYSSFRIDITPLLTPGTNRLAVAVENYSQSSRWYPGAGIYRSVYRVETDPVYFEYQSLHCCWTDETKELLLEGSIADPDRHGGSAEVSLESPLFPSLRLSVKLAADINPFSVRVKLRPHQKWDVDSPVLYSIVFRLNCGIFQDEKTIRYGIRTFQFTPEHGFILNGRRVKINGVCLHHDLGPLGAAFNRAAAERQLLILREMGCNAIRTSHNPPAPDLLELCDEHGFLVMDEAFDVWHTGKLPNDYSTHFDADSEKDLTAMILRDRNHPCVILWSIGNEVSEIRDSKLNGRQIAHRLTEIVHKLDPERPVTAGFDCCEKAIDNGLAAEVDIPAWNYRPQKYAEFHRRFPAVPVLGSETLSTVSSRGIYYFPAYEYVSDRQPQRPEHDKLQCSSYCLDTRSCSTTPEAEFLAQDAAEYVAGQFIWTGVDYLGEPSPYNEEWLARSSYFGCIDLVGLPKDLFYLVQSQWRKNELDMVHIVPHHWNWRSGMILDIHVFSSCEEVELLVNGHSLGCRTPLGASGILAERYRFIWHGVRWRPGEIRAVGFRAQRRCAEEILHTAEDPFMLKLHSARTHCSADGEDMVFATVSVLDAAGNPCPNAAPHVRFQTEGGSLVIVAADGGNAASLEPFHTPECTLFSGMAVIYLRSTGSLGKTVLRAESDGLCSTELVFNAKNICLTAGIRKKMTAR